VVILDFLYFLSIVIYELALLHDFLEGKLKNLWLLHTWQDLLEAFLFGFIPVINLIFLSLTGFWGRIRNNLKKDIIQ